MSKIVFNTNIPVELRLQTLEGRPKESNFGGIQHMFFTTDGAVFYVSEAVGAILAQQIKKQGVQVGEPVEIVKAEIPDGKGRKTIQWKVSRVGFAPGEQPDGTFVIPKDQPQPNGTPAVGRVVPANGAPATNTGGHSSGDGNGSNPPADAASQPPTMHFGWCQFLLANTTALVDIYALALKHADKHGSRVKPEDVRALLTTAFINITNKGGGPNVA